MRQRLLVGPILLALVGALVTVTAAPAGAGGGDHEFAAGVVRLSGSQEVPGPGDPDGFGRFGYFAKGDQLCYFLTAHKIDPAAAAHIHAGAAGVAGGIVVGLEVPDPQSAACITAVPGGVPNTDGVLSQADLDAIIANPAGFYANVHNAAFQAGAIRGQLR
ncbi:MAG TPA: CHRD domain-containing protein [Acidimicrobiales bacterium]|nr:CHRD domain-containing protein [Acidimicrobiales bacterium]